MAEHTVHAPPESITRTPSLPAGVNFYSVVGFADTQEAYDALTERRGWTELTHEGSTWEQRPFRDGRIVVHAPTRTSGGAS